MAGFAGPGSCRRCQHSSSREELAVFVLEEQIKHCAAQTGFSQLFSVDLVAFAVQQSGLCLRESQLD